jgi:hypothetical protein
MLGLGSRAIAEVQLPPGTATATPAPTATQGTITTLAGAMTAALNTVQAAVTAVGTLATASLPQLAALKVATLSAVSVFANAVTTFDGEIPITTFAGMNVGDPAPTIAAALLQTTAEVQALGYALNGLNYVQRINANVLAATG